MGEPQEPLNLTSNAAFRAFFKENDELLISILQDFLPLPEGYKIESVSLMDGEETPEKLKPEGKTYRLDLKVKLFKKGEPGHSEPAETVNVEMQTTSHARFTDRILAYASRIYSSQLGKGEAYGSLQDVYSLVFTTQNLAEFDELRDQYYHVCDIRRAQPPHLRMTQGIQFILVELDKFVKELREVEDQREAWCWLLKYSQKIKEENNEEEIKRKGKDMKQAVKHLWKLSSNELLREQLEAEDKFRQDHEASLLTSYHKGRKEGEGKGREEGREEGERKGREEGEKKGREEGREEGEKKGREEGREEGEKKGREEERKTFALKLLKKGIEPTFISEATGLSKEEVNQLKE